MHYYLNQDDGQSGCLLTKEKIFKRYYPVLTFLLALACSIIHFLVISHKDIFGRISIANPATTGWFGILLAVQSLMNLVDAQWWNPKIMLVVEVVLVIFAMVCLAVNAVSDWPAAGIASLLIS